MKRGSTPKWGDEDEDKAEVSLKKNSEGFTDLDEGAKGPDTNSQGSATASSSATEMSNNSSPSQKDEQDPNSAESLLLHRGELTGYTVKGCLGKFASPEGAEHSGTSPREKAHFIQQFLSGRM